MPSGVTGPAEYSGTSTAVAMPRFATKIAVRT